MIKEQRYIKLKQIIRRLPQPVVVAYSGGVDSTFLLKAAVDSVGKNNVIAIIGDSPTYQKDEKKSALAYARKLGVNTAVIKTDEMQNPRFYKNPPLRCYHCKNELFGAIKKYISAKKQFSRRRFTITYGATLSDENDYRPGLIAARRNKVVAPLKEAGLTKDDVRRLSRMLEIPTHSKPAQPCLASRFPYGEEITQEKIRLIEKAENYLKIKIPALCKCDLRVRYYSTPTGRHCARIEVSPSEKIFLSVVKCRKKICRAFKKFGFSYISLDLEGFRTGSANEIFRRKT